jgi:hypothetical protein
MELPQQLKNEIWDYCRLNNITNIDGFTVKLVKQGFTVEKFGSTPAIAEKIVEKIVEKVVEVPVEVEKVVEKIVEVTVEKEVYITDDSHTQKLTDEIERLQKLKEIHDTDQSNMTKEILELMDKVKNLEKELELEKKKKKTDIYGE